MDSECSLVSDSTWICSRLYRIYDRKTLTCRRMAGFVGLFSIAMYWLATWLTFKGTSIISRITSQGFLLGTVLPGVVIIVMAIIWIAGGNRLLSNMSRIRLLQVVNVNAGHVHRVFSLI